MHRRVTRKENGIDGVYLFLHMGEANMEKVCRRCNVVIINNIKKNSGS
jgi:hypothetical protein